MSEVNRNRGISNMSRGSREVYEEEWEYDCGILLACDKGDDDSQIEWEDYKQGYTYVER